MNRIVSGKIRLDVQRLELATVVEAALDSVMPSAEAKSIAIRRTIDAGRGPRLRGPESPPAGRLEPAEQRGEVHAEGREDRRHRPARELPRRDPGARHGHGHRARVLAVISSSGSGRPTRRRRESTGASASACRSSSSSSSSTEAASRPRAPGKGRAQRSSSLCPCAPCASAPGSPREHPTAGFAPTSHAGPHPPEISLAGLTVLVVDDEPDARELVRSVLIRRRGGGLRSGDGRGGAFAGECAPARRAGQRHRNAGLRRLPVHPRRARPRGQPAAERPPPSPSRPSRAPRTAPGRCSPATRFTWPSRSRRASSSRPSGASPPTASKSEQVPGPSVTHVS